MKRLTAAFLLAFVLLTVLVRPAYADDVIWATGTVTLSEALTDAIATLLETDPPEDATLIYAMTYVSGSSSSWIVSLINLDISAPYDTWDAELDGEWVGNVVCSGTEPSWTCDWPATEPMGGTGGLIFPWGTGLYAKYGVNGVHDGAAILPGSYAVDFVGYDNDSSMMTRNVVSAADGEIDWICQDDQSMAIRVIGGPVSLAYFHFALGNTFEYGAVRQGQVLGSLRSGTFSGVCGSGWQDWNAYHLHFVFYPTTGNYLQIGGAILDITSQNFVLDGKTYSPTSYIPNDGGTGFIDPGADDNNTSSISVGGSHIWDGIVAAIAALTEDTVSRFLPDQNPAVNYFLDKISLMLQAVLSFWVLIYVSGVTGTALITIILCVIVLELNYWTFKIGMYLVRIIL